MQVNPVCKTAVECLSPFLLCTAVKCKGLPWILPTIKNHQKPLMSPSNTEFPRTRLGKCVPLTSVRKLTLRTSDSKYKLDHIKLQEPHLKFSAQTTYIDSSCQHFFPFSGSSFLRRTRLMNNALANPWHHRKASADLRHLPNIWSICQFYGTIHIIPD